MSYDRDRGAAFTSLHMRLMAIGAVVLSFAMGCRNNPSAPGGEPPQTDCGEASVWQTVVPFPDEDPKLYCVSYGVSPEVGWPDEYYVGGSRSFSMRSVNGRDWNMWTDSGQYDFRATAGGTTSVSFVGGGGLVHFVGGTSGGGVVRGTRFASHGLDLRSVAYGDGTYVAVGEEGNVVLFSEVLSGGQDELVEGRVGSGGDLLAVAWTGSRFVTAGQTGELFQSSDGRVWTHAPPDIGSPVIALATQRDVIIALAQDGTIRRFNGDDWSVVLQPGRTPRAISSGRGGFTAVGEDGMILNSEDGLSWQAAPSGVTDDFYAVAQGPEWVAVGAGATVLTSIDGTSWCPQQPARIENFFELSWCGEFVVAVTSHEVLVSTDGVDWVRAGNPPSAPGFRAIAWSGRRAILVGQHEYIAFSDDLRSWTVARHEETPIWLESAVWTGSHFVTGGARGTLLHSTDGANWTVITTGTDEYIAGLAHHAGTLVATTLNGSVLVFDDDWNMTRYIGVAREFRDVHWIRGAFYAVGGGDFLQSTDGHEWTRISNDQPTVPNAAFGLWDGRFVAVGSQGRSASSTDGVQWTLHESGTEHDLYAITGSPHGFFAGGRNGVLLAWSP